MRRLSFLVFTSFSIPLFFLTAAKRPNVLFAFADDWGRQASIYAKIEGSGGINDVAKTPHFDKLARSGAYIGVKPWCKLDTTSCAQISA